MLGIQAAYVLGDWEGAAALADLRHESPPDLVEAMVLSSGLMVRAGRGDAAALDVLPGLVPHGRREGMVSLFAGFAAIDLHGDLGDLAAATAAHDETVATLGEMWANKDFQARIRMSGLLLGQLASAVPGVGSQDRDDLVGQAGDLVEAAHRAVQLREQSVWDEGPEGRAWLARVAAEHARLRWLVGDDAPDPAQLVAAWQEAVDAFDAFGHVFETARSRARLAAVLRATGHPAEAAEQVRLASAAARALGAEPLLRELRSVGGATATRAEPNRRDDALTARELEVLALVAQGRSNKEIGGQLFISAKTVSVHVSNLMAKLGASGRTEAAAIARRRGYLTDERA